MSVVVIDLGIGNLMSIIRGLEYCGAKVIVTSNPKIILNSSHVVLPGDGAFKFAMEQVKKRNLLKFKFEGYVSPRICKLPTTASPRYYGPLASLTLSPAITL